MLDFKNYNLCTLIKQQQKCIIITLIANTSTMYVLNLCSDFVTANDVYSSSVLIQNLSKPLCVPPGTSNWSYYYFLHIAGSALVVNQTASRAEASTVQCQLKDIFERDWNYSTPV